VLDYLSDGVYESFNNVMFDHQHLMMMVAARNQSMELVKSRTDPGSQCIVKNLHSVLEHIKRS